MRSFPLIICICLVSICSFAQNLEISGTGPDLYLEHSVLPKENFYSIGRNYNVSPKDIAAYNKLTFEDGLSVGQRVKIPLSNSNFLQSPAVKASASTLPVIHKVLPKEGLYRISMNYNKVPLELLKDWNHLSSDDISIGAPIIIGFLKIDKSESSLANQTKESQPTPAVTTTAKKEEPKKITPPPPPNVAKQSNEQPSEPKIDHGTKPEVVSMSVASKGNTNFGGGYFKKMYDQQVGNRPPVRESGSGSVFKSTSGWKDGKYYCFNNDALPGTVIRVTDQNTGKSIFAKVLDVIPEIKQNENLVIIISNSAVEELGTSPEKFDCEISFIK